jgi:hypothetical protein
VKVAKMGMEDWAGIPAKKAPLDWVLVLAQLQGYLKLPSTTHRN